MSGYTGRDPYRMKRERSGGQGQHGRGTWRAGRVARRQARAEARKYNELKPSKRSLTARDGSWGNIWRRDSYSTRGIGSINYSRLAWGLTILYFCVAGVLFVSNIPIWQVLYWMIPIGFLILWLWRFVIYEWIDLIRDVMYRDRKLRRLKRENAETVGTYQPGISSMPDFQRPPNEVPEIFIPSTKQLEHLLNSDPAPHRHLGMDWETYRRKREQREQRD